MNEYSLSTQSALEAFSSDVSYAVAIVSAAVGIKKKRKSWQLKRDLKSAETAARKLCEKSESFVCLNQSPCGIGSCRFASGEFASLKILKCKGNTPRPQKFATGGSYNIDVVLFPLAELRESLAK